MNSITAGITQQEETTKAVEMKNQMKVLLVQIYAKLREWGPLVVLALIVPGGSLLALWILHRHHAHGSTR
jgi:hypothetical protein